ncbi:MAG: glycoside hydrolase family 3 N-terminal domain-containing protein [Pseudomonadota bacterium]
MSHRLGAAIAALCLSAGCASSEAIPVLETEVDAAVAESFSPRVNGLLTVMTVDEKLGQLVQAAGGRSKNLNSKLTPDEFDRVRRGGVGSYLHVAGAEPLGELQRVAIEESAHGIPLLFAMDVVHGYRTIFPVPLALASTWEPADWKSAARISAEEATASGLHWTFAPMVDIARDGRWGRIVEGAGSDPYFGSRMAVAQVQGYQGGNLGAGNTMLAATKHLGAYGAALGGRDYGAADISEATLHEIYLPPFYAATEAGSGSFMTAFNDISGVPTTSNEHLIDGILRERWGFDGVIVSDWNAIAELMNHGVAETRADAGALALKAGVDMDMTSGIFGEELAIAIESDPALLGDLDLAVGRILTAKERLGLFDNPMAYHDAEREAASLLTDTHRAEARRIAARSIVMLKNENGALPLQSNDNSNLLVVGALADDKLTQLGSWRARGQSEDVISILEGIQRGAKNEGSISYLPGTPVGSVDLEGIEDAVRAAERADHVLLVIGEDFDLSGEARSRSDISMPESQKVLAEAIFATDTPVTVILVTGRPLAIPSVAENADAILNTWMLGVEAGPAIADVLFGETSPAGRLPVDFPRATGQSPIVYSELPSGRPADPDLSIDTNRYIDLPITPLYPFGHGLSYTDFDYGELSVSDALLASGETVSLSLTVTNTGSRGAEEVVQLYMRDPVASVSRPKLELRGFKRIALDAGERKTVSFEVSPAQSAIYQADGTWKFEAGTLEFFVGASSTDIRQSVRVNVLADGQTDVPAAAIETAVQVQ